MNQTSDKTSLPTAFNHEGRWIADKQTNADNFNNFYSQVGPRTNQSVKPSDKPAEHYLRQWNVLQIDGALQGSMEGCMDDCGLVANC